LDFRIIPFILILIWVYTVIHHENGIFQKPPTRILSDTAEIFHILEKSANLENAILEFDISPLSTHGHIGGVLSYCSKDSWIYLGCDMNHELFGKAV
jgi:hypothetical protein